MRISILTLLLAGSVAAGACDRTDPAAVGTSRLVEGTSGPVATADPTTGPASVLERTAAPAATAESAAPAPVAAPTWREVTIPAGTSLPVILDTGVGSDSSQIEEPVHAHLARSVSVGGSEVLPQGSRLSGVVTDATRSGKVKGRARVAIRFDTLVPEGEDERYSIETISVARRARATKKKDALEIGLPAAGGAALGALIGTAAGGGAGTAVVLSTRGEEARLAKGAPITLRLTQPLTMRIRG